MMAGRMAAGVAGQPIAHSLSPLIHSAWIAAVGLDATYKAFGPEDEAGFDALVETGRAGQLRGLNVTAPFKERALALADQASDVAQTCGSANLLLFEAGRVHADSTDGAGLMGALNEQAPVFSAEGRTAVVLGAGGAARAAVAALVQAGAAKVYVLNRTLDRAQALAEAMGGPVEAGALEEAVLDGDVGLVVNALSVAPDIDLTPLRPGCVVMDMTYRPLRSPLLIEAERLGLTPVDGLAMLIAQARPSFQALFGQAPPEIDVRSLALARLEASS